MHFIVLIPSAKFVGQIQQSGIKNTEQELSCKIPHLQISLRKYTELHIERYMILEEELLLEKHKLRY